MTRQRKYMQSSTILKNYQNVKQIFFTALDLDPSGRDAFLSENCTDHAIRDEVESLLSSRQEAGDFLEDISAVETVQNSYQTAGSGMIGQLIGNYRIEKEIGRGGMGIVFLAKREDFRQDVALKIVKRGMDTDAIVNRFYRERQILADLAHPYIAKLLDGGTTGDGLPF